MFTTKEAEMQATTLTKKQAREMAATISTEVDGKGSSAHVTTWMDRPGCSLEVRFQSASDGKRIIIHKWDDEELCSVRYIFGSFWRPRVNREGVEYGKVEDVDFTVEAISEAIATLKA